MGEVGRFEEGNLSGVQMICTLVNRLIAYLALVRQSTPAFNLLSRLDSQD